MNPETIRSPGFWEEDSCFVAGEFDGEVPDLSAVRQPVLFKTSGSTGQPKWIVLEKQALLKSAAAVNRWLGVSEKSKWGLAIPLNHVGGFGVVARSFEAGCELSIFEGKWEPTEFAKWIEQEGITHVSLVPTQVHDLVKAGLSGAATLAVVVVGGGKVELELGQAARDAGWPVLASYGMTETCSQVATQEIKLLDSPYLESPLKVLPVWETEVSASGLLLLKGDALFSGVVERVDGGWKFSEREGAWFGTRDRVSLVGNILVPEGRADLLVKVMGELVDLEKLERCFLEVGAGRVSSTGFAIVPVKDARKEHALVLACEGVESPVEEIFQEYNSTAAGIERLDRWLSLHALPKTDLGKLKRGELRDICELIARDLES